VQEKIAGMMDVGEAAGYAPFLILAVAEEQRMFVDVCHMSGTLTMILTDIILLAEQKPSALLQEQDGQQQSKLPETAMMEMTQ
jgi:hypothetical protein